jgi:hypothetical protein
MSVTDKLRTDSRHLVEDQEELEEAVGSALKVAAGELLVLCTAPFVSVFCVKNSY